MARVNPIQTTFTAGELSPRLEGRVDLRQYDNGLQIMENFYALPHGGAAMRPGIRHVAEAKNSAKKTRLIPFEFSTTQAYILEFGDQYMRVYKDEGQVQDGGSAYEISTPYGEDDLFEIRYAQSADVLYLAHPGYAPRKLERTGHTSWTLSTISFTGAPSGFAGGSNEYPRAVALYEQRSVWAGTNNKPQTIWFSKSGDFEDMTIGSNDDDATEFTIASDKVNVIQWLSPGDSLIVGTVGGEFEAHGGSENTPITPTTIQINRQTTYGVASIQPLRIKSELLFVQRAGRKVREFTYEFETDGYVAPDLSLLSEHITKGGIKDWDYKQEPDSTIWLCRNDGVLLGFTYNRPQEVVSWSRHPLAGTDAKVESVAVIPTPSGDSDQVWFVVSRTVNGSTVRYIEFMEQPHDRGDDQEDAFYLDSGLTYDGSATTSISGLDHLEGETVSILADGAVHPDKTVSSGTITLDYEASKVHVGLGYTGMIKTMRQNDGARIGTAQGKTARVHSVSIRFHETLGAKVGPNETDLETVLFRTGSDPMDSAPPLYNGDKEVPFRGSHTSDPRVVIKQTQPLPCTVLVIMPELAVYER